MIIRKRALRNKIALVLLIGTIGFLISNAIKQKNDETIVNKNEHLEDVQ